MNAFQWLYQWDKLAPQEHIRAILGRLLFSGEAGLKAAATMSGGECARLLLAKLLVLKHNVLVLDEPTNHLDIESIEGLLDGLKAFTGTIVFVSHDRHVVSELATRIVELRPRGRRQGRRDRRLRRHLRGVPRAQGPPGREEGRVTDHASGTTSSRRSLAQDESRVIGTVFLRALTEAGARYGVQAHAYATSSASREALLTRRERLGVARRRDARVALVPELSSQPDFGLVAAETMPPGSYGELEYAVLSSANAKEALARAVRFQRVTYAMSDLSFAASGPHSVIRSRSLGLASDEEPPPLHRARLRLRRDAGPRAAEPGPRPLRVAIPHWRRASTSAHQRIFGEVAHFDQPRAELVYATSDLERPLASHDPAFLESFSDEEQKLSAAAARAASSTKAG